MYVVSADVLRSEINAGIAVTDHNVQPAFDNLHVNGGRRPSCNCMEQLAFIVRFPQQYSNGRNRLQNTFYSPELQNTAENAPFNPPEHLTANHIENQGLIVK
jgi:hypothetical protein